MKIIQSVEVNFYYIDGIEELEIKINNEIEALEASGLLVMNITVLCPGETLEVDDIELSRYDVIYSLMKKEDLIRD